MERGRGRGRGSYHSTLGYQRSSSLYDEDIRGGGNGGINSSGGSGRVSQFFISHSIYLHSSTCILIPLNSKCLYGFQERTYLLISLSLWLAPPIP